MVLLIVQTVMNGFGDKIRENIVARDADIRIVSNNILYDWKDLLIELEARDSVLAATPYAEGVVMMKNGQVPFMPFIRGIHLDREAKVFPVEGFLSNVPLPELRCTLDDLDDENIGFDALEDEEGDLDELGIDDEGSEVTITLTADEADLLKSIVGKLGGDEEDDLEDLDDGDDDLDFGSEDPLMEDGEAKDLPDAVGKMTSKGNMKVKGKASQNTGAVNATSSAPKGGDGKPSNLADGVPRMTKKTAKADANLKHIGD